MNTPIKVGEVTVWLEETGVQVSVDANPGQAIDLHPKNKTEAMAMLNMLRIAADHMATFAGSGTMQPQPKRPARNKNYSIAALSMSEKDQAAFERVWQAWPTHGFNYSTNSVGARRSNYALACERFKAILDNIHHTKSGGERLTADDLADAALGYLKAKKAEAIKKNLPAPCIHGIDNFFSSDPASKKPWQNALLEHFGVGQ